MYMAMTVMIDCQPSRDHGLVVVNVGVSLVYTKTLFNLQYYTLSLGSGHCIIEVVQCRCRSTWFSRM